MPSALSPEMTTRKSDPHSSLGQLKIIKPLRGLLEEKKFSAIIWADIAGTAGADERLLYLFNGKQKR
ncbi:MAG: hypothetical protein HY787_19690 [Deltaproteobacteria bacterium]|nr:hypothetical protein [Deltaproteobacteria bacterium]